jgi:hypothetical protein
MQQYIGRGKNLIIVQDTVLQSALPILHTLVSNNFVVAAWEDPGYWKSTKYVVHEVILTPGIAER